MTLIQEFLNTGTQIGILIDPEIKTVEIYRSGQDAVILAIAMCLPYLTYFLDGKSLSQICRHLSLIEE